MSKVIVISQEEIESILDARFKVFLERFLLQTKQRQPDDVPGQAATPYVSKREAARLISVCPSTIDNNARAGKLKRHYVGKAVRFDRLEVLALAKSHTNHKQKNQSNEQ